MSSTSSSPMAQSPLGPLYLPEHIVVLVHGNNGAPSDLESVRQTLRLKYREDELLIINSSANHTQTSLGVDVGGEKLALEIVTVILKYDLSPKIDKYKFSIIGHSLGGLYARYAIAQVQEELSMLNIDYVSFVTLCTPHLGSRRPRAPSTLKNFYRMGVHTVLASKSIYGQTGVDLLVSNDPRHNDSDQGKRPVLEVMSEHDSVFVRALRKFHHCTLMAMADGDVVVPFPSASIRNYNPYPSLLLTKKFDSWRWHIRHYGFDKSPSALLERLNHHVDELLEIDPELAQAGLDVTSSERFASVEGEYDSDNKHEVEFTFDLIQRQQSAVPWRRLDILVEPNGVKGKLRLHDWPINKMQLPDCGALEFIDLLTDVIGSDHGLELRRLPAPLSDSMINQHDVETGVDEERKSRLSFPKWSVDTNQIGEQVGTFFQNVKNRFSSQQAAANTSSETESAVTSESASASFMEEVKSRLTPPKGGSSPSGSASAEQTPTVVADKTGVSSTGLAGDSTSETFKNHYSSSEVTSGTNVEMKTASSDESLHRTTAL